jgi:hypothetical protein
VLAVAGVTDTAVSVTAVSVALPETAPDAAEIVVVPTAAAVARPPVEMVATEVAEELHVTDEVISLVVLSE